MPPPKIDQPPRRSYNEGREAFQRGDLAQAEAGFIAARDGAGDDAELRFRAAFNLGLLRARKAEGLVKEKPEDAMAALQESAAWFRDAVRQRPEDRDARANLERVLRRAQRLTDQLNQGQNGLLQRLTRVLQQHFGWPACRVVADCADLRGGQVDCALALGAASPEPRSGDGRAASV